MIYDKAYLISLEQSIKRRERFYHYAVPAGLDVQWIPAIYGLDVDIEAYQQQGYLSDDFELRMPGSLGTLLSHVNMWDIIANDPYCERGLIFEDDAQFSKKFIKQLSAIPEDSLPEEWDMLWLGWHKMDSQKINRHWGKPSNTARGGVNSGHFAYIIRASSVEKMKSILFPYNNRSSKDVLLRKNFDKFGAYFILKRLARTPYIHFDSIRKKINNPKRSQFFNNYLGDQVRRLVRRFSK